MAEQTKTFHIAVFIDSKNAYKNVVHGDILYELKPRNLHFKTSQKYVKGDINVISDCCNFVQEIDTETYIKGLFRNSNDITNSFKDIVKIQLFRFKDGFETMWHEYVAKQTHTHSSVVIIVNDKNQPVYILSETDVSILGESITFKSCLPYQANDIKVLNSFAVKLKTFTINNKWKIRINKTDVIFKNAICYNFVNQKVAREFFNSSYDVGLVTNDSNQMILLLSEVTYIRNENAISFKSDTMYKNGFYQRIKQCGELKKSLKVNEYRLENNTYTFDKVADKSFVPNKCLLFTIKDIDAWIDFIETQTNEYHDIGIVTSTDDTQIFFLNKVHIDGNHNVINFGGKEQFTAKHNDLIYKFGAFVKAISLKNYTIPDLDKTEANKGELKNINFYTWDMNKKPAANGNEIRKLVPIQITPAKSVPEQREEKNGCQLNKRRKKKMKSKSAMPAGLTPEALMEEPMDEPYAMNKKGKKVKGKKNNKNKKGSGKVKKKGRSKSAMPAGIEQITKGVKKQRNLFPNKSRGSKKKGKLEIKGKNEKKKVRKSKKSKSALPQRTDIEKIIKSKAKNKGKKKNENKLDLTVNGKGKGHGKRKSESNLNVNYKTEQKMQEKLKGKKKGKKVKKKKENQK